MIEHAQVLIFGENQAKTTYKFKEFIKAVLQLTRVTKSRHEHCLDDTCYFPEQNFARVICTLFTQRVSI